MTAPPRTQPNSGDLIERLRQNAEMLKDGHQKNLTKLWHSEVVRDAATDAIEAAARIQALEEALQFIADGYDNHDVNHVDYRVKVYQVALDALQPKEGAE